MARAVDETVVGDEFGIRDGCGRWRRGREITSGQVAPDLEAGVAEVDGNVRLFLFLELLSGDT